MFTGVIQELGVIKKISAKNGVTKVTIEAPKLSAKLKIGGSIAVDGACLTVTAQTSKSFEAEIMAETINKTIAKNYKIAQKVNLEPVLKLNDLIDGHLVSGHIDFNAPINQIKKQKGSTILTIDFPPTYAKYMAMKGSVTVNGVSLTISKLHADKLEVSLIPHTLKITNLGLLKKNSAVNIEIDLLARYLENLLSQKDQEITYNFLQQRGFI